MSVKFDLNGGTKAVLDNNITYDDASGAAVALFPNIKVNIGTTSSVTSVTLSGFGPEVSLALTTNVIKTTGPNGYTETFSVASDGAGDWTISYTTTGGSTPKAAEWRTILAGVTMSAPKGALPFNTIENIALSYTGAHSGSDNIGSESVSIACFMPGTLVRTPSGEAAVETLERGDLVLTHDGREVPVCWLGRQTVSLIFADRLRVLPIRIKAGALAENVPARDLLVSPDHAMFVDGVLIHAGALVNDASIIRETDVPAVYTYYHVEVADHSLILAEGAPAETFVDNVDRLGFDNWDEYEALYPEGKTVEELPYPRAKARRQVPVAIRVALASRAEAIGAVAEVSAVA